MEEGGLLATCFRDQRFMEEGCSHIEENFNLDWGIWGPNPSEIPPGDYSVRWHGWLMQERTGSIRLVFEGKGEIKVLLGGERVLNWTDLTTKPIFGGYEVEEFEYVPIEIYYRYGGDDSRISIKMEDPLGRYGFLGTKGVYHPASSFSYADIEGSEIRTSLRAVDWTGRVSDTWGYQQNIDRTPPGFHTDAPRWYGKEEIVINASVSDPIGNGIDPISLDLRSIQYRKWEEDEQPSDDWTRKGIKVMAEQGNLSADLSVQITGTNGWKGFIQFRASDLNMNIGESKMVPIGFDMEPPAIKIMVPLDGDKLIEGDLNVSVRAHDIGGSGVDPETMEIRWREVEDEWEDWVSFIAVDENGEVLGSYVLSVYPSEIELQARCWDWVGIEGISDIISVNVKDRPVNNPPVPVIARPLNGSFHYAPDIIRLDATGTTDDGLGEFSDIHLSWYSNLSGLISNKARTDIKLRNGYHRITLFADDGTPGHNVSTYVDILVGMENEEQTGPPDGSDPVGNEKNNDMIWFILLIVVTTVLTIGGILLLLRRERRSGEEVKLEIGPENGK